MIWFLPVMIRLQWGGALNVHPSQVGGKVTVGKNMHPTRALLNLFHTADYEHIKLNAVFIF